MLSIALMHLRRADYNVLSSGSKLCAKFFHNVLQFSVFRHILLSFLQINPFLYFYAVVNEK